MAREKIETRAPTIVGGRPRSEATFSGLLHCEKCGQPMYTESSTGRSGVRYHYYNCRSFLKGMGCFSRRIPVGQLDEFILDAISTRIFTPENIKDIVLEVKAQGSEWARDKQARIDAMAGDLSGVERRLRRLYETIEADAGLNLNDIAPRLRELRARQEQIRQDIERLDADPGPQLSIDSKESAAMAKIFRNVLVTAENTAKVREFVGRIVQKIIISDASLTLEYLPERIVNARSGGSQWDVKWLPDRSTLRTARLVVELPGKMRRAA